MQLEVAYIVEVTKLTKYVTSKEDPLIQIVRIDRHITDSALLQTEVSRENYKEEQDNWRTSKQRRQKKDGKGRGYMGSSHVT